MLQLHHTVLFHIQVIDKKINVSDNELDTSTTRKVGLNAIDVKGEERVHLIHLKVHLIHPTVKL